MACRRSFAGGSCTVQFFRYLCLLDEVSCELSGHALRARARKGPTVGPWPFQPVHRWPRATAFVRTATLYSRK
jgi:hypothetical protein